MAATAQPDPTVATSAATERADRILAAAAELLVRYGYRKVTIEDVAGRAGIGKGTVYLHWRTKRHLFEAVVIRESIAYVEELVAALRADPAEMLPHRLLTTSYRIAMGRPVLRALGGAEASELRARVIEGPLYSQDLLTVERLFDVMSRHGLFRADIPNLQYTLTATAAGFYLLDELDPTAADLELDAKVEALAYTVRHAFEPPEPPDAATLAAAAAEAISVSEELLPPYRQWIYSYDRKQRTS